MYQDKHLNYYKENYQVHVKGIQFEDIIEHVKKFNKFFPIAAKDC